MKGITIIIEGEEYVAHPKTESAEKARTGYERVEQDCEYYINSVDDVIGLAEIEEAYDKEVYDKANYYSDEKIAKNNARADRLIRRLRQWQALNDEPVDWSLGEEVYYIYYDYNEGAIKTDYEFYCRSVGDIYFSTEDKAKEAIEVFRHELIWYYTEYVQRLDEQEEY